jgi:hypothetical protein
MAFVADNGGSNFFTANLSALPTKTISVTEPAGLASSDMVILTMEYSFTGTGPTLTTIPPRFLLLNATSGSISVSWYYGFRGYVGAGPYVFVYDGSGGTAGFRQHEIATGYSNLTGNADQNNSAAGDTTPGGTSAYSPSRLIVVGRGNSVMTQDATLSTRQSTTDGAGVELILGDEALSSTTVPTTTGTGDNAVFQVVFQEVEATAGGDAWAYMS